MADSALTGELLEAYRQAVYHVAARPPFALRVGQQSVPLMTAHQAHGVECSAFITACNPRSLRLDDEQNVRRQSVLDAALRDTGLCYVDGFGHDHRGHWPGEPSFLVFGLSLHAARGLALQFDQNALLWIGEDAIPQLLVIR